MALEIGAKLGPYEITALLGKGGMGEVYKAHDPRLNRDVAIKVSNEQFSDRFSREARAIAALNHTNVCHLYDVVVSNDAPNYLVMEYVEGTDLRGPLDFDDALPLIQQLIDGIEAAHEKGIVHRDLKPANIKVTADGVVKILDFGLAKVAPTSVGEKLDPENSPTMSMAATAAGAILGTAAYMAPEQAKGKTADSRADIWAFGVIVYELLSGKKLFTGESAVEILTGVLHKEPDLSAVPERVHRLLRWCLEKDRKNRLAHIGDARRLLSEAQRVEGGLEAARDFSPALQEELEAEKEASAQARASAAKATRGLKSALLAAALLAIATAVLGFVSYRANRPVEQSLLRLSVDLGPDAIRGVNSTAAISPDGTRLVFLIRGADGKQQLATRRLDQATLVPLRGTENASDPFFSPDGQWIGFFADRTLQKISVQGGAPLVLCEVGNPRGASWGSDGYIVASISANEGLVRIPEVGGPPERITKLDTNEASHRWPQVLPGSDVVIYTSSSNTNLQQNAFGNVDAISSKTGKKKTLVKGAYFGRYISNHRGEGYLLYLKEGTLFGTRFDAERLEVQSTAVPLLDDVANTTAWAAQFDISATGTLIYTVQNNVTQTWPIVWLDSAGNLKPLLSKPQSYDAPRLSPEGQRLAMEVVTVKGRDVYLYDIQRDNLARLTTSGASSPIWAPDGKHLAYSNGTAMWWVRADGASAPQKLLDDPKQSSSVAYSFSPDGKRLAYFATNAESGNDLWTVSLDLSDPDRPKLGRPEPFLNTRFSELEPVFSPDGRWLAYRSNESGRMEVYVRPSDSSKLGKWQISDGEVRHPRWSPAGGQLFWETLDSYIMVVDYSVKGDSFVAGKPRRWSPVQVLAPSGEYNMDLSTDGKQIIVFPRQEHKESPGSVHVTFLLNFFDELRRSVPVK